MYIHDAGQAGQHEGVVPLVPPILPHTEDGLLLPVCPEYQLIVDGDTVRMEHIQGY